jgi:hypothetical protein
LREKAQRGEPVKTASQILTRLDPRGGVQAVVLAYEEVAWGRVDG